MYGKIVCDTPPSIIGLRLFGGGSSSTSSSSSSPGLISLLVRLLQLHQIFVGFLELRRVHALARVPVEKCFAAVHRIKSLGKALEHRTNARVVAEKCRVRLQTAWRNINERGLGRCGELVGVQTPFPG